MNSQWPSQRPLRHTFQILTLISVSLTLSLPAIAQDWPQWRGPSRNGDAPAFEPPAEWPETLTQSWKIEVGKGDSSPLVADSRIFVFSRDGDDEVVAAYRLADGSPIWRSSYPAPFKYLTIVKEHEAGPFSTPTYAEGRLYTLGIKGVLSAWNGENGDRLWQREFSRDFKRTSPFYGSSQAPLVVDDRVFAHVGGPGDGAFIAFDKDTGKTAWSWKGDGPAYGAPVLATLDGTEQLVTLTQRNLVGLDPSSGKLLWQLPFILNFDLTSLTPVIFEGTIILSGYDKPTRAFRPTRSEDGWQVEEAWSNGEVSMQFASPVVANGKLYGYSHKNSGQVVILDPKTGELLGSGPGRQGENAYLLAAGNQVVVIGDNAEMHVLSTDTNNYDSIAEYEVAQSAVWAHPVLLQRHLLIKDRNHLTLWEVVPD